MSTDEAGCPNMSVPIEDSYCYFEKSLIIILKVTFRIIITVAFRTSPPPRKTFQRNQQAITRSILSMRC
jgi:hypothetical protein